MASLFDTSYGDTQRGIGWYPRREPARPSPSLWDYIEAASIAPIPIASDAAAAAVAGRDFARGDIWQGLGNAAGVLPGIPALGQIFTGVKGANKAQKQALVTAQRMAKEGANRDEIWNATMWYRGKDGKWRTEIDDSGAKLGSRFPVKDVVGQMRVGFPDVPDVLGHPALYDVYPDLKGMRVYPDERLLSGASYGPTPANPAGEINIGERMNRGPREQARSNMLHELQHAIQQREGMARGGSPEMFAGAKDMVDLLAKESDNMPSVLEFWKRRQSGATVKDAAQGLPREAVAEAMGFNNIDEALLRAEQVKQEISRWADIAIDPYTAYRSLLGEVDARNTQKRMDMTLDQRREFPPWSTWDVPEADQIVRFGDGPAMSIADLGKKVQITPTGIGVSVDNVNVSIKDLGNGKYAATFNPLWGGSGKPFEITGSNPEELLSQALAKANKSMSLTEAAKTRAAKTSLVGMLESKTGAKFTEQGSTQSRSKYLIHDPSGLKVRISDHPLPPGYEGADLDLPSSMSKEDLANAIAEFVSGNQTGLLGK